MPCRKRRVDDVPNAPASPVEKTEADDALGIESFGFTVYTVEPGERLPWDGTPSRDTRSRSTCSRACRPSIRPKNR